MNPSQMVCSCATQRVSGHDGDGQGDNEVGSSAASSTVTVTALWYSATAQVDDIEDISVVERMHRKEYCGGT